MKTLIIGGAGFIGINAADRLSREGHQVTLFDDLSREGVRANLDWLAGNHPGVRCIESSIRDPEAIRQAVQQVRPELVLHFAAQAAVTSSLVDPRHDFSTNALGTFNVLEAVRHEAPEAILFYASTNKVYGALEGIELVEAPTRYRLRDHPDGLDETTPLDFRTPYGCSKGCGDQYVQEYHRSYGLRRVVLRFSCIYGPHQFGVVDQGWVAWFIISQLLGRQLTIFGDGKQVRDILHVDDLIEAILAATAQIDKTAGGVFNIGGGPQQAISVWSEFGPMIEGLSGLTAAPVFEPWRPGDQRVYISDIRLAERTFGWRPRISVAEGLADLHRWVSENKLPLEQALALP